MLIVTSMLCMMKVPSYSVSHSFFYRISVGIAKASSVQANTAISVIKILLNADNYS